MLRGRDGEVETDAYCGSELGTAQQLSQRFYFHHSICKHLIMADNLFIQKAVQTPSSHESSFFAAIKRVM